MRIAFDLDGTLIPAAGSPMLVERLSSIARCVSREQIRAGTPRLLRQLRGRGHEVWLYTTSFRNPTRMRVWFATFGVRLDGVVNQTRHNACVTVASSKYPPAFGIDLLVDDAEGVRLEGKRFGFRVLNVNENDAAWCTKVESAVRQAEVASSGR